MAAAAITINKESELGRQLVRYATQLREAREGIQHALDAFVQQVDGNGTDISHFTFPVTAGVYPTTSNAKASWDETQSLNAVMENAEAAISQWCAKHGV